MQIKRPTSTPAATTTVRPSILPGGCFPLPPTKERVTLSLGDRANAWGVKGGLEKALGGLGGAIALSRAPKSTVKVGLDGTATGPEGQPLVTVRLSNGRTAYVDPNTNQYYVASQQQGGKLFFGAKDVRGPIALPKDLEFSNSHFSAADCKQLSLDANRPPFRRPQFPTFPSRPQKWVDLAKNRDGFEAAPVSAVK